MRRSSSFRPILSMMLIMAVSIAPSIMRTSAAPQDRERGPGQAHQGDPCDRLQDRRGDAAAVDRPCPAGGSSSGVAKGDFNNDGFADLAIGEPGATIGGQAGAGDVIILYGSGNGLTTGAAGIPSNLFYEGRVPGVPEAGDGFGSSLASGDFNGDGFSDLAIGIPGKALHTSFLGFPTTTSGAGAVVILYGSSQGLGASGPGVPAPRVFDLSMSPDVAFFGLVLSNAHLGASVAWGDFDGNSIGDLAIGTPGLSLGDLFGNVSPPGAGVGGVWQLLGTSSGLGLTSNKLFMQEDAGLKGEAGDHFGASLAAGDFNRDGYTDLAIGIPDEDFESSSGTIVDAGEVVVLSGGPPPSPAAPKGLQPGMGAQRWSASNFFTPEQPESGDHFGAALAAGDFDGNGYFDLAIAVPGKKVGTVVNAGIVNVLYGSTLGFGLAFQGNQLWNQNMLGGAARTGNEFGTAMVAGDFNGDGKADLAIGIPFQDVAAGGQTLANAGEVEVIYGTSFPGLSIQAKPAQILHSVTPQAGARFGAPLTAWNFGLNETSIILGHVLPATAADLVVGAPFQTVNGLAGAGAIHVIYGSFLSGGLNGNRMTFSANTVLLAGEPLGARAGAHFGAGLY